MSESTKIQWADATFNPWIGCTKVSPGCKNCYAEHTTRARVLRAHGHETWGKGKPRSRTSAATWRKPIQWNEMRFTGMPRLRVFPSGANERIPELLKIPAAVRFLSVEPMLGPVEFSDVTKRADSVSQLRKKAIDGIDWVILGGESGPNARPCDVDWIYSGIIQCHAAGAAVFVKQLGSVPVCQRTNAKLVGLTDKKGGDMSEWHESFRVREFPNLPK